MKGMSGECSQQDLQRRQAVEAGQRVVGQHQVGRRAGERLAEIALRTTCRQSIVEPVLRQLQLDQLGVVRIVLEQHEAQAVPSYPSSSASMKRRCASASLPVPCAQRCLRGERYHSASALWKMRIAPRLCAPQDCGAVASRDMPIARGTSAMARTDTDRDRRRPSVRPRRVEAAAGGSERVRARGGGVVGCRTRARRSTAHKPDVAVVDLALGADDGVDLVRWIRSDHPRRARAGAVDAGRSALCRAAAAPGRQRLRHEERRRHGFPWCTAQGRARPAARQRRDGRAAAQPGRARPGARRRTRIRSRRSPIASWKCSG